MSEQSYTVSMYRGARSLHKMLEKIVNGDRPINLTKKELQKISNEIERITYHYVKILQLKKSQNTIEFNQFNRVSILLEDGFGSSIKFTP